MAKRKRKNKIPIIFIALCLAIVIILGIPYIKELVATTSHEGETVTVEIPMGASTENIGQILKENKLIKSVTIFKVRAKLSDNGSKMNYGTFNLNDGMCIPDIINTLAGTYAYRPTVMFTVPEGFSVQQIAARAESLGLCSKGEFLEALKDDYNYGFIRDIPRKDGVHYRLQGFLYPETYEFYADSTAYEIIDRMLHQFEKETKDIKIPDGKSLYEVVTVASMLEREALLDVEMPRIAGVIYNRLEKGMRLQVDATVQYVVSEGEYNINRVTYSDLEAESPYNTYRISSLPVGPISNVSVMGIKAALNPEKHDYLYYHTDTDKNDGSHIFTKTYKEHLSTQ
ncbi:MAG: endolytic transglycosylase MltG [Clostridia bacterium]|nr:endolytic transglycosylase MltG [Clostridia bacterium]